jgi:hypothetical protein
MPIHAQACCRKELGEGIFRLEASFFFLINGRRDWKDVFTTSFTFQPRGIVCISSITA